MIDKQQKGKSYHPRFVFEVVDTLERVGRWNVTITKTKDEVTVVVVQVVHILADEHKVRSKCSSHLEATPIDGMHRDRHSILLVGDQREVFEFGLQ